MSRPLWKGTVSFGLVNIPVALYGATDELKVSFRTLHKGCAAPIAQQHTCTACKQVVERADEVKGYEVEEGRFVVMEEADFAGLPVASQTSIKVVGFVDSFQVDPRQLDEPYFMGIGQTKRGKVNVVDQGAAKGFALLHAAMQKLDKLAVAKVTMRQREKLVVFRPYGDVMLLQTLRWPDELRSAEAPALPEVSDKELALAESLVNAIGGCDLTKFSDEYREALEKVIQAKAAGQPVVSAVPTEAEATVDVMGGLEASLAALRGAV